jgi:hypothetical protein
MTGPERRTLFCGGRPIDYATSRNTLICDSASLASLTFQLVTIGQSIFSAICIFFVGSRSAPLQAEMIVVNLFVSERHLSTAGRYTTFDKSGHRSGQRLERLPVATSDAGRGFPPPGNFKS